MIHYNIEFEPLGRRGECAETSTLLDCARSLDIGLINICGGHGKCFGCKIQVVSGKVSELSGIEKKHFSAADIKSGWRLACLTYPLSDCKLYVPPESMTTSQRLQTEGIDIKTNINPAVKTYPVAINEPDSLDRRSDAARLLTALNQQNIECSRIDFNVMQTMSGRLRQWNWKTSVAVRNGEVVALLPPDTRPLGLAVDIGTTKIAAYLLDMNSGHTLAVKGIVNPQISYGEDITSRIQYSLKSRDNRLQLQKLVISAINDITEELCKEAKAETEHIVDAVFVGNTAIHHLALGLPVQGLAYSPFAAVVGQVIDVKAREPGLNIASGAYIHFLPNIAGFVGADHVAVLTAIEAQKIKKTSIAIDIGTNTEVSLIHQGKIYSASCASGPAFEGGHITHGMRASGGAIERVRIFNGELSFQTIENKPPAGICGSGIIDIIGQAYQSGIISDGGRIVKDSPHTRILKDIAEIIIARNRAGHVKISMSQKDIRELQLAKGAIRAGIQLLMGKAGVKEENIDEIIIAGAFGNYIDIENAINIGLLPDIALNRFKQVGNAAGSGARLALISAEKRTEAIKLAEKVQYIELASVPEFMNVFTQSTYLGRYRLVNGKREAVK